MNEPLWVGGELEPTPSSGGGLFRIGSAVLSPATVDPQVWPPIFWRTVGGVARLLGAPVFAAAVLAALVVADVLTHAAGLLGGVLVGATLVVAALFVGVLVAVVRPPPAPLDEVELPAGSEPELRAEIQELARQVGTRAPDRIVVVAEANAYVRQSRAHRTLAFGAPLLDVLEVSELRAVLAHELGHFAAGAMRLGPITCRARKAVAHLVRSRRGDFVGCLFLLYWLFQRRVGVAVLRAQERTADDASARVAGRQAAADALWKVEVASLATAVFREAYLMPLLVRGCRPDDLVGGWRALTADDARQAKLASLVSNFSALHSPLDTHPPTAERIQRLAHHDAYRHVPRDRRPSTVLLRDPERWGREAAERWLAAVTEGAPLEVVAWKDWPQHVGPAGLQKKAESIDAALIELDLEPGVVGLHAALVDGRRHELASRLRTAGWADTHDASLIVIAAVEAAVKSGAGRWYVSWSAALEFRTPDGDDAFALIRWVVQAAVAGYWQPLFDLAAGPMRRSGSHLAPPPLGNAAAAIPRRPPSARGPQRLSAVRNWLWDRPFVFAVVALGACVGLLDSILGLVILLSHL